MTVTAGTDLQIQIETDLKQAMRERNDVAKLALRAVKTALTEASKAGDNHQLSQEQVLATIQKEVKRRRDTAAEFEKFGAADKAAAELAEVAILEHYLPRQLSEAEVEAIVRAVIAEIGATSQRELGKVMSAAMPRVQGIADGRMVNGVARRLLNG